MSSSTFSTKPIPERPQPPTPSRKPHQRACLLPTRLQLFRRPRIPPVFPKSRFRYPPHWLRALSRLPQSPKSSVKKLALLVGINRYQHREIPRLRGAVNDVNSMKDLLETRFGFDENDIVKLTDNEATRKAIMDAFRDHLIAKTKGPGDEIVVFHYSGHGSQRATDDPNAENGWYETIVPHDSGRGLDSDINSNKDILDYDVSDLFTELRANTRFITFIFDSCHSGDVTRNIDQAREAPLIPASSSAEKAHHAGSLRKKGSASTR